ncbi:hypothetical protein BD414DRAFT_483197 [Trametes punicea]|nr:hypothetical protein BD414DRAFT_483197 [Trametes punicea]
MEPDVVQQLQGRTTVFRLSRHRQLHQIQKGSSLQSVKTLLRLLNAVCHLASRQRQSSRLAYQRIRTFGQRHHASEIQRAEDPSKVRRTGTSGLRM